MAYKVRLEIFEGPFDLLVYLIENAKMNIYDIQVSEITAQYIDYVKELQQMDVAVSSDFMVLAAELIELKSKLLLPRVAVTGGEAVDEDPRAELAEKLLAYKSFKHISKMLSEKEDESACIRTKPKEDLSLYTKETEELLELDIDRFVSAFNLFLGKKKKVQDVKSHYEKIQRQKISAEERIRFIQGLFAQGGTTTLPFHRLVMDEGDRYDVALSFSSVLELVKQKQVMAQQRRLFGEILVSKREELGDDHEE